MAACFSGVKEKAVDEEVGKCLSAKPHAIKLDQSKQIDYHVYFLNKCTNLLHVAANVFLLPYYKYRDPPLESPQQQAPREVTDLTDVPQASVGPSQLLLHAPIRMQPPPQPSASSHVLPGAPAAATCLGRVGWNDLGRFRIEPGIACGSRIRSLFSGNKLYWRATRVKGALKFSFKPAAITPRLASLIAPVDAVLCWQNMQFYQYQVLSRTHFRMTYGNTACDHSHRLPSRSHHQHLVGVVY
jgi:hypothetical protein